MGQFPADLCFQHPDHPVPATPAPGDLVAWRLLARLTRDQAAELAGVAVVTWRRWERGRRPIPLAAWRLLLVAAGVMPWPAWRGWIIAGSKLYAPEQPYHGWTPGELRGLVFRFQLEAERRRPHEQPPADELQHATGVGAGGGSFSRA